MGLDPRKPGFLPSSQDAAVTFHLEAAAVHEEAARFWETRGKSAKAQAERVMTDLARRRAEAERNLIRS